MEAQSLSADARDLAQRFGVDESAARAALYRLTLGLVEDSTADCDALVREFHAENIRFYERYIDDVYAYTGYRAAVRAAIWRRAYRLIRARHGAPPRHVYRRG